MLVALDVADERDDFTSARALMVISQTFYRAANGASAHAEQGAEGEGAVEARPDYLQHHIVQHRMWSNSRFWEAAVRGERARMRGQLGMSADVVLLCISVHRCTRALDPR